MKKIKKLCFDIDGVVCSLVKNNDYKKVKPIKKNIKMINKLFLGGHYILLFTARHMGRTNDNVNAAEKAAKKITQDQLKKWGVTYDKLVFGKPSYDVVIDDKSLFYDKNWIKKIEKFLVN